MHNLKERRIILISALLTVCLATAALLAFLIHYSRESLYPTDVEGYYRIEYLDGEDQYQVVSIAEEERLPLPALSKTGYTFEGWTLDANGTLPASASARATGDLTLYAQWTLNRYTVVIMPNYPAATDYRVYLPYNQPFEVSAPQRGDYTFEGWYYDAACIQAVELSKMPDEDVTVFAKWRDKYLLNYVLPDGFDPIGAQYVDLNQTLTLPTPTDPGYTFSGWYFDEERTQAVPSGTAMPNSNLTLYGAWTVKQFAVTFTPFLDAAPEAINVDFGAPVTLPEIEVDGYTFVGWYLDDLLTVPFEDDTAMPAYTLVLYPKYEKNLYYIMFDAMGGSEVESITAEYEADLSGYEIEPSTRPGYDFVFWYSDPNNENVQYQFDTMPLDGLILYARWSPREDTAYTIEYYFETSEGDFALDENETEHLTGTTEASVSVSAQNFAGYAFDSTNPFNYLDGTINGEGTTVFKLYYTIIE